MAIQHNEDLPPDIKAAALSLLASLPSGDSLCHGDFHPDNIILAKQQPIIIDWLDASQGPPLADVARTLMLFTIPPLSMHPIKKLLISWLRAGTLKVFLDEYFSLLPEGKDQLDDWLSVVLAARLAEKIPEERGVILAQLDQRFKGII